MEAHRHGTAVGIVRAFCDAGIDTAFFVTGGDQAFWIALKEAGVRLVLARSEAASVAMADGYSRVTGRPSLVYGQWGPGAANVAAALAEPYWGRSPVVALTTSVATTGEGKFAYQELDQLPLFAPVTKWNRRIPSLERAAEFAALAVHASMEGCSGPVHLTIPKDWLASDHVPLVARPHRTPTAPAPTQHAVDEVASALRAADRPVLLAGAGVLKADSCDALAHAAEVWGLPVLTTMGGKGAIGELHANAVGVAGRYSRQVANDVMRRADLVVAVGTDLGGMATDDFRLPDRDAAVVQVDVDASRLGVSNPRATSICSDAGEFLVRLGVAHDGLARQPHEAWLQSARSRTADWHERLRGLEDPSERPLRHEVVLHALRTVANPRDVLVADTGFTGAWAGAVWQVPEAGRYFVRAAGTLGWAFAAALGVQHALPDRRAICLIGDGGVGYTLGELETARRLGVPVVVIVLNNSALAYEYLVQKILYETVVPEVNDFVDVDFAAVARAVGIDGWHVETAAELEEALRRAFAERRPALIDVRVGSERAAPTTSFESHVERVL